MAHTLNPIEFRVSPQTSMISGAACEATLAETHPVVSCGFLQCSPSRTKLSCRKFDVSSACSGA